MSTIQSGGGIANDAARKKSREELHKQIAEMGLSEKVDFLKKSFRCKSTKGGTEHRKDYIEGAKSFFGKGTITNRCQFQLKSTVNLKHIIGYCCNDSYELCPLYQFHACSSALMRHIKHR